MKVEVVPYSPYWIAQFHTLRAELQLLLADTPYLAIEHVGSTSVPGLAAKPVIDIDIVVRREQVQGVVDALTKATASATASADGDSLGGGVIAYQYMGEWGIPDRHAFRKRDHPIVHNLYACVLGSQSLRNHLALRDVCRRDSELRDRYGQLKMELAKREWEHGDEYCDAKTELVALILEKGGMGTDEVSEIGGFTKYVKEEDR